MEFHWGEIYPYTYRGYDLNSQFITSFWPGPPGVHINLEISEQPVFICNELESYN